LQLRVNETADEIGRWLAIFLVSSTGSIPNGKCFRLLSGSILNRANKGCVYFKEEEKTGYIYILAYMLKQND
jgi:hypothetical protein